MSNTYLRVLVLPVFIVSYGIAKCIRVSVHGSLVTWFDGWQPYGGCVAIGGSLKWQPTIDVTKLPCTHAPPMHRYHARPSLPVNQIPHLTPPNLAPFELHDTAATLLQNTEHIQKKTSGNIAYFWQHRLPLATLHKSRSLSKNEPHSNQPPWFDQPRKKSDYF